MVPAVFAIGPSQPMDGAEGFPGLHRSEKCFRSVFKVVRVKELLPSEVEEVFQRPSTVCAQSTTNMLDLPRGRSSPKHRGHCIDDVKKLMFAHLKGAFGPF